MIGCGDGLLRITAGRAKGGVAVIIAGEMRDCLKEWQCVSERLVKVRIRFEKKWTTFIQVYAPTEDSEEEEKDRFYASLEGVLAKVKKDDRLVLMGDLNGRVGRDVETWGEVIGRYGEETQNDNGRRFLGSCTTNGLTIMNGRFEHKEIHKYTWECRGRGLRTIIDYFAVRKDLRPAVADVKVIRGAEAGSDHYLVLMKVNLRWSRQEKVLRNEGNRPRLRLKKLIDWGVRVRFQTELGKFFEKARDSGGEDVEEAWKEFKGAILASDREGSGQTESGQAQESNKLVEQ